MTGAEPLFPRRSQFLMRIDGEETAWVVGVHGHVPIVHVALNELHLTGTLAHLRDRLEALTGLLDDVEAQPERWWEISAWANVGPKHHRRITPNPFIRRPNPPRDS